MFPKLITLSLLAMLPFGAMADSQPSEVPELVDIQPHTSTKIDIEEDQDEVYEAVKQGKVQPFSALYDTVGAQLHGRVIKVELEEDDNEWVYELKLMHNNKVIKAEYDASTLELLELQGRDLIKVIK